VAPAEHATYEQGGVLPDDTILLLTFVYNKSGTELKSVLERGGFVVVREFAGHMDVTASYRQILNVIGVELFAFRLNAEGQTYYGNIVPVPIPDSLPGVTHILGLNNIPGL